MRFTIRDVLWLTMLVAMGVAWWLSYWREAARNYHSEMLDWKYRTEALKSHLENAGSKVSFDDKRRAIYVQGNKRMEVYYYAPTFLDTQSAAGRR